MQPELQYTILQIQEDDYGCEERSEGSKRTVLVRLRDSEENEHMIRQEDDWLYEQEINEGDQVIFVENRLYKNLPEIIGEKKMKLETTRLLLRPWQESDAESCYEYAKDPQVGPSAGWPVHTSVENSRETIKNVLSADGTYAVVLKASGKPVGCAGLTVGAASNLKLPEDEGEIGCWLGVPYWGQGIIPEAVQELIRYGFEDLGLKRIWYAFFDGNEKSKRVAEKCGFRYHHTNENLEWKLLNRTVTEHVYVLDRHRKLSGAQ